MLAMRGVEEALEDREKRAAELHGEGSLKLTDELPINSQLVARIRNDWYRNRTNKYIVERRMLNSLRARKGEYSPEKTRQRH